MELAATIRKEHRPIANKWAGQSCTLNGKPATVAGRLKRFAFVAPLNLSDGGGLEFCWETVDRIMSGTKAFKS